MSDAIAPQDRTAVMPDGSLRLPRAPLVVALDEPPGVTKAVTLCVMVVAILYFGREVLVPVMLALLLAFLLAPLVAALRRLHLGRVPSVRSFSA